MPPSTSSKRRWILRVALEVALLLLAFAPLWVPRVRAFLESQVRLEVAVQACALKGEAESFFCYREVLQRAVKRSGPQGAAELCGSVEDPTCAQAFGALAPNQSWCAYLRGTYWPGYAFCLVASCRR